MPQMSLGNGYTIDLADGWTFVHALQDALQEMQQGYNSYITKVQIYPPGNDGHSQTFSSSMTQAAVANHETWYQNKVSQLQTMIANVEGMLHQYQIAETANTIQWAAPEKYNPNDDSDEPRGRHGAV